MRLPVMQRIHRLLFHDFRANSESMRWWWRLTYHTLRVSWVTGYDLLEGTYTLPAMSLVYKTLQSLVPLLALSFSVLQGFGFHTQMKPILDQFLVPFGESGADISWRIIDFVSNVQVGILGSVGLVMLLFTAVTTFQMVEHAINSIWQIKQRRSFYYRFIIYSSLIIVGPVVLFAAFGITVTLTNATIIAFIAQFKQLESVIYLLGLLVPFVMVVSLLTVLYKAMPATHVSWRAAIVGGTVAGMLWELAQWAFTVFVARSAKYEAIYSGFAILIVFFVWVYVSWLIVLIGTSVVHYVQYPSAVDIRVDGANKSLRFQEQLALATMVLIGTDYELGIQRWSDSELSRHFHLPVSIVNYTLEVLKSSGFVLPVLGNDSVYVPAHPLDSITVANFYERIRTRGEYGVLSMHELPQPEQVSVVGKLYQEAFVTALGPMTLRDLSRE